MTINRRTFLKGLGVVASYVGISFVVPQPVFSAFLGPSLQARVAELKLKLVANISTSATVAQVRQALSDLNLQTKAQNRIIALANGDPETGVPSFNWRLKIIKSNFGVQVYPKLIITVDTTRTDEQLLGAINEYFNDLKGELRLMCNSFPNTFISSWHVHRIDGAADEREL